MSKEVDQDFQKLELDQGQENGDHDVFELAPEMSPEEELLKAKIIEKQKLKEKFLNQKVEANVSQTPKKSILGNIFNSLSSMVKGKKEEKPKKNGQEINPAKKYEYNEEEEFTFKSIKEIQRQLSKEGPLIDSDDNSKEEENDKANLNKAIKDIEHKSFSEKMASIKSQIPVSKVNVASVPDNKNLSKFFGDKKPASATRKASNKNIEAIKELSFEANKPPSNSGSIGKTGAKSPKQQSRDSSPSLIVKNKVSNEEIVKYFPPSPAQIKRPFKSNSSTPSSEQSPTFGRKNYNPNAAADALKSPHLVAAAQNKCISPTPLNSLPPPKKNVLAAQMLGRKDPKPNVLAAQPLGKSKIPVPQTPPQVRKNILAYQATAMDVQKSFNSSLDDIDMFDQCLDGANDIKSNGIPRRGKRKSECDEDDIIDALIQGARTERSPSTDYRELIDESVPLERLLDNFEKLVDPNKTHKEETKVVRRPSPKKQKIDENRGKRRSGLTLEELEILEMQYLSSISKATSNQIIKHEFERPNIEQLINQPMDEVESNRIQEVMALRRCSRENFEALNSSSRQNGNDRPGSKPVSRQNSKKGKSSPGSSRKSSLKDQTLNGSNNLDNHVNENGVDHNSSSKSEKQSDLSRRGSIKDNINGHDKKEESRKNSLKSPVSSIKNIEAFLASQNIVVENGTSSHKSSRKNSLKSAQNSPLSPKGKEPQFFTESFQIDDSRAGEKSSRRNSLKSQGPIDPLSPKTGIPEISSPKELSRRNSSGKSSRKNSLKSPSAPLSPKAKDTQFFKEDSKTPLSPKLSDTQFFNENKNFENTDEQTKRSSGPTLANIISMIENNSQILEEEFDRIIKAQDTAKKSMENVEEEFKAAVSVLECQSPKGDRRSSLDETRKAAKEFIARQRQSQVLDEEKDEGSKIENKIDDKKIPKRSFDETKRAAREYLNFKRQESLNEQSSTQSSPIIEKDIIFDAPKASVPETILTTTILPPTDIVSDKQTFDSKEVFLQQMMNQTDSSQVKNPPLENKQQKNAQPKEVFLQNMMNQVDIKTKPQKNPENEQMKQKIDQLFDEQKQFLTKGKQAEILNNGPTKVKVEEKTIAEKKEAIKVVEKNLATEMNGEKPFKRTNSFEQQIEPLTPAKPPRPSRQNSREDKKEMLKDFEEIKDNKKKEKEASKVVVKEIEEKPKQATKAQKQPQLVQKPNSENNENQKPVVPKRKSSKEKLLQMKQEEISEVQNFTDKIEIEPKPLVPKRKSSKEEIKQGVAQDSTSVSQSTDKRKIQEIPKDYHAILKEIQGGLVDLEYYSDAEDELLRLRCKSPEIQPIITQLIKPENAVLTTKKDINQGKMSEIAKENQIPKVEGKTLPDKAQMIHEKSQVIPERHQIVSERAKLMPERAQLTLSDLENNDDLDRLSNKDVINFKKGHFAEKSGNTVLKSGHLEDENIKHQVETKNLDDKDVVKNEPKKAEKERPKTPDIPKREYVRKEFDEGNVEEFVELNPRLKLKRYKSSTFTSEDSLAPEITDSRKIPLEKSKEQIQYEVYKKILEKYERLPLNLKSIYDTEQRPKIVISGPSDNFYRFEDGHHTLQKFDNNLLSPDGYAHSLDSKADPLETFYETHKKKEKFLLDDKPIRPSRTTKQYNLPNYSKTVDLDDETGPFRSEYMKQKMADQQTFESPNEHVSATKTTRTTAPDPSMERLLNKGQRLHDKKMNFLQEKMANRNPYIRDMLQVEREHDPDLDRDIKNTADIGKYVYVPKYTSASSYTPSTTYVSSSAYVPSTRIGSTYHHTPVSSLSSSGLSGTTARSSWRTSDYTPHSSHLTSIPPRTSTSSVLSNSHRRPLHDITSSVRSPTSSRSNNKDGCVIC